MIIATPTISSNKKRHKRENNESYNKLYKKCT